MGRRGDGEEGRWGDAGTMGIGSRMLTIKGKQG